MNNITPSLLEEMKSIVGAAYFFTDEESFAKYGSDETEKLHYAPQVVVKPRSAEEISKLLILSKRLFQKASSISSTELI